MATPVICVGGFMSTTLQYVTPARFVHTIWLDVGEFGLNGPDNLQLAADGVSPGPLAEGPLNVAGDVVGSSWSSMRGALQRLGYTPFQFYWDWRLDLAQNAGLLVQYIIAHSGGQPFYVIAHSAGGLVTQLAYQSYLGVANPAAWLRTLNLGVPFGGSYTAVSGLATYYNQWGLLYYLAILCGGLARRDPRSFLAFTDPITRLAQVVSTWPALLELMPAGAGIFSGLDSNTKALYTNATWIALNPFVFQPALDRAAKTQAALNAAYTGTQPPSVDVIAINTQTLSRIQDVTVLNGEVGYASTVLGDGVVTQKRAQLPGHQQVTIYTDHSSIPGDTQLLSQLGELLTSGSPVPTVNPVPALGLVAQPAVHSTIEVPFPGLVSRTWPSLNSHNDP